VLAVILQPSYLAWRGYFDLVRRADVFVFYDDVQYDKHSWRNRNRIKTPQGSQWLTIPVLAKGNITNNLLLKDIRCAQTQDWARKHAAAIRQSYARAPFFDAYWPLVEPLFREPPELLCDVSIESTIRLAGLLGISGTRFVRSSELGIDGGRTERLVSILRHLGADRYLSGPSARAYIEEDRFRDAGIDLEYMVYDYPEYAQLHPPFDGAVSVLDLLFMQGPRAGAWIWGTEAERRAIG
jgi:hypothetical protein